THYRQRRNLSLRIQTSSRSATSTRLPYTTLFRSGERSKQHHQESGLRRRHRYHFVHREYFGDWALLVERGDERFDSRCDPGGIRDLKSTRLKSRSRPI